MFRIIKMWWLMRRLKQLCTPRDSKINRDHLYDLEVNEISFLEGLAWKKVHPYKKKRPCHGCAKKEYKKYEEKYGSQISKKMNEYKKLIDLAYKKKYISINYKPSSVHNKTACKNHMISLTEEGHEFTDITDLFEFLLRRYKLLWTFIFLPVVIYIIKSIILNLS